MVKCAKHTFNQVDTDQSQKWLNGTRKKGDGITKNTISFEHMGTFYNMLSYIASEQEQCFAQVLTTSSFTTNAREKGGGRARKMSTIRWSPWRTLNWSQEMYPTTCKTLQPRIVPAKTPGRICWWHRTREAGHICWTETTSLRWKEGKVLWYTAKEQAVDMSKNDVYGGAQKTIEQRGTLSGDWSSFT